VRKNVSERAQTNVRVSSYLASHTKSPKEVLAASAATILIADFLAILLPEAAPDAWGLDVGVGVGVGDDVGVGCRVGVGVGVDVGVRVGVGVGVEVVEGIESIFGLRIMLMLPSLHPFQIFTPLLTTLPSPLG